MSKKVNKFKVGDEVEIVSIQGTDGIGFRGACKTQVGSKGVIAEIIEDSVMPYSVREHGDAIGWVWSENNLKLVEETNNSQNDSIKKTLYSPLTVQQAGDHYKKKGIQPIEYGLANNLSFPQVNVVKYITRHEDKNGLDDLAKSIHYHFFEALRVYGEEGTHELRNKVLSLLGIEQGVFK